MSEKNSLISLTDSQENPAAVRGSDFPYKSKSAEATGKNELFNQSATQCGPRHNEDSGDGTPSVWGKGGTAFPVGTSAGEGGDSPKSVSISERVNFVSGQVEPRVATDRN